MNKGFWKAGHPPTLFAAFFYFDLAFMVWVMLGPLGVQIAQDLQLSAAQKGLMVATPVLPTYLLPQRWPGDPPLVPQRKTPPVHPFVSILR